METLINDMNEYAFSLKNNVKTAEVLENLGFRIIDVTAKSITVNGLDHSYLKNDNVISRYENHLNALRDLLKEEKCKLTKLKESRTINENELIKSMVEPIKKELEKYETFINVVKNALSSIEGE